MNNVKTRLLSILSKLQHFFGIKESFTFETCKSLSVKVILENIFRTINSLLQNGTLDKQAIKFYTKDINDALEGH